MILHFDLEQKKWLNHRTPYGVEILLPTYLG